MIDAVKGLGEIYKGKNSSMWNSLVNSSMHKVKESDQVVGDGCSLQAATICRIKIRSNNREKPVTKECFINLAEERSTRNVSQLVL